MKLSSRALDIAESLQYGFLYMGAAFVGGVGLDFMFPRYSEETPTRTIILEVIAQCLSLVVLVYFIRSVIGRVPFLFHVPKGSSFTPYMTHEYEGEMMMGLIFLGVQLNLVYKLDKLARELYMYFFNKERDALNHVGVVKQEASNVKAKFIAKHRKPDPNAT